MGVTKAVTDVQGLYRSTPAERLNDLARHIGDPWLAGELASIASELEPRRPGRPPARTQTAAQRRNELLRSIRHLPPYAGCSLETVADRMRRDFRRFIKDQFRFDGDNREAWAEIKEMRFEELPASGTIENILKGL